MSDTKICPTCGETIIFIEGQETWRGLTKLAKDPQRLRNFLMSYVADIASRSPRPKPFFFPEQVAGFQDMYDSNGADNNYAYYLLNRVDQNGAPLPIGNAGAMPEQTIPQSVGALMQMTTESLRDTLPDTMNADFADIELSGDAIAQLNGRVNQQSVVFQQNLKHSKRRDAEIWLSFASKIFDTAKEVTLTKADGTRVKKKLMKMEIDKDSGEPVMKYNLKLAKFHVTTEVGPSFQSQRDQARKELAQQIIALPPDDPMREVIQFAYASLLDGIGLGVVRKFANKQMVVKGYKDPETEEEMKWVQEAQQASQKPDPQDVLLQLEGERVANDKIKAQADMIRATASAKKVDGDLHNHNLKAQATIFNVETGRMNAHTNQVKVAVDAKKDKPENKNNVSDINSAPKPKQKTIGDIHMAPIENHPVHGQYAEKDIHDTMRIHGLTRKQVLEKLRHHNIIHEAMQSNG